MRRSSPLFDHCLIMSIVGELLETGEHDGPMNMAVDELLWHRAAAGVPALRFYGWSDRPALSIGYFQRGSEWLAQPKWRDLPCVRRMTGGGAIVHDHDLTYSLSLPAQLAPHTNDLYLCVHRAFVEALAQLGVPADLGVIPSCGSPSEALCFRRADRFAVRVRGVKVLGSAQRRQAASVLMQGSLLIASSAVEPNLVGIDDLMGRQINRESLRAGIVVHVARALDVDFTIATLDDEFWQKAKRLSDESYRAEHCRNQKG